MPTPTPTPIKDPPPPKCCLPFLIGTSLRRDHVLQMSLDEVAIDDAIANDIIPEDGPPTEGSENYNPAVGKIVFQKDIDAINMSLRIMEWEVSGMDFTLHVYGYSSPYAGDDGGFVSQQVDAHASPKPFILRHNADGDMRFIPPDERPPNQPLIHDGLMKIGERTLVKKARTIHGAAYTGKLGTEPREDSPPYGWVIPGIQSANEAYGWYQAREQDQPPEDKSYDYYTLYHTHIPEFFDNHIPSGSRSGWISLGDYVSFSYPDPEDPTWFLQDYAQYMKYKKEHLPQPPLPGGTQPPSVLKNYQVRVPNIYLESYAGRPPSSFDQGDWVVCVIVGPVENPKTEINPIPVEGAPDYRRQLFKSSIKVIPLIGPAFDIPAQGYLTFPRINNEFFPSQNPRYTVPKPVVTAKKFFPYSNQAGDPVYDETNGRQINDPFAKTEKPKPPGPPRP